ncbi:methylated-DNA--[protein]-cysteine S-methyltransferase [Tropicibacter naphthalenivorans]|uniref:Methylated-DNA--protein-cysteine methyltransferase n=1 Tax=Tropicibacter naphthalenivorans TaxID=441103 RepID=A0A0P1G8L5_9RHOB|nr:methylated-DNA--[protein]-cysteine S-methyltransferase [Tropicibacter naphthalenivorans]CUH77879.1 Methylated-DNA--protein-cysteine methyltransferase, constitutive [Tropicibacter naphthalenivorans]SMC95310.1 methylated-DNA-[protein]-cysteine S-methyltransferase [Tropicibacter naphthalenivorans]
MRAQLTVPTPTGPVTLTQEDESLVRLTWDSAHRQDTTPLLSEAKRQIDAYFAHDLKEFDLPLHVQGSPFQASVCAAMSAIPFGETRTYGDLASALGVPAQAIGQACGGNPLPLLIPCHRVLGRDGLGGFSGGTGIETKVHLLKHEGAASLLI